MTQRRAASPLAYPPEGAYSPAVEAGRYVFVSGQLPLDARGAPTPGPVTAQARRAVENVRLHLESIGLGLESVVMVTIYVTDEAALLAVDEVSADMFPEPRPARTVIGVSFLPHHAALCIDAVAARY